MNEVHSDRDACHASIKAAVAGGKATTDKMFRDGTDVLAGVFDDFKHLGRVGGGEVKFKRTGALPALALVGAEWGAVIFFCSLTGANLWKITNGIFNSDWRSKLGGRKQILFGNDQFTTVFVADGRAVILVRGFWKGDFRSFFHTYEDQSFTPLWDPKIGGVEYPPLAVIAQASEAFRNLSYDFTVLMCCQTDDVFHDQCAWSEVIHKVGKLLKKTVAWIVVIRGTERAD